MIRTLIIIASLVSAVAEAKSWSFLYSQDGLWFTDKITLDENGWPELIQQAYFTSERIAKRAAGQIADLGHPPFKDIELISSNGVTLWNVTEEWSWAWEIRFAEWVKTELNSHWWKDHGLATDCADVVYSARWIFAREHGLPMANHLITGHIFSYRSVKPEWESLPTDKAWEKDQRFLAALNYLLSQTFTHSLWRDSYPIAITQSALTPGAYHLQLHDDSGHTQFVNHVGLTAEEVPLLTLNSTVPREVRDLEELVFFEDSADEKSAGFLRMRWPQFDALGKVSFVPANAMPHYSVEQFETSFVSPNRSTFWEEVFFRLNPFADFDRVGQKTASQIVDLFKARVPIVERGFQVCNANPCLPGSPEYNAWSTPSRDRRIRRTIDVFDSISSLIYSWSKISRLLEMPILSLGGSLFNGEELMSNWRSGSYSSNPNHLPEVRWGL